MSPNAAGMEVAPCCARQAGRTLWDCLPSIEEGAAVEVSVAHYSESVFDKA